MRDIAGELQKSTCTICSSKRISRGTLYTLYLTRQNAKNAIKKDFFKLMNHANFGYDCRNNVKKSKFELIELNEINYIKKYYNLFDSKISNFVKSDVLEQQIEQDFQKQIANVKHDDPFRSAKINSIKMTLGKILTRLIA